jgi:NADH:ubiquinone oxidoreductase subunit 6 (subunit J)
MVGRGLAVLLYVVGVGVLLYVSVYLPYVHSLENKADIAWEHIRLWVPALAWVLISSMIWAVTHSSSEVSSNGGNRGAEEDNGSTLSNHHER